MSIVRTQPTPAACAAVYQTARLLHLRKRAREILQLWDALPSFDAFETARRKSYNTESLALDEKMAVQGAAPTIALPQISDETADTSASPPVSPGPPEVNGATASRPRPSPPESSDGSDEDKAVDIYEPVLLFGMADNEVRLVSLSFFFLAGIVVDQRFENSTATMKVAIITLAPTSRCG